MHRELGTELSDKISDVSVDDMTKVKVGVPAVSWYHQINCIFPEKDGPVFNDHDFPVPGYLTSVSGHMFLQDEKKLMYHMMKARVTQLKLYPVSNQIFKKWH